MKTKYVIPLVLLIFLIWFLNSMIFQNAYWMTVGFLNPYLSEGLEKKWKEKSSDFLLAKMHSKNFLYPGVAADILIARKDKSMVPKYLLLLNSKNTALRGTIINALGEIGDKRTIKPLVELVINKGPDSANYFNGLLALAKMKYTPIFENIKKLALSADRNDRSYAIDMLEAFDDEKSMELLANISENDLESLNRMKALRMISVHNK